MGINIRIYGVFGVQIPWNDAFNEDFDLHYDDPDQPFAVLDGMGGEYMVLGYQLFCSEDFRYCDGDGDLMKSHDPATLERYEREYREEFGAKYPQWADLIAQPFKIIMFTHYS